MEPVYELVQDMTAPHPADNGLHLAKMCPEKLPQKWGRTQNVF